MVTNRMVNVMNIMDNTLIRGIYPSGSGYLRSSAGDWKEMMETGSNTRILYLSAGDGIISGDGKEYILRQGELFILFPNSYYQFKADASKLTELWWVDLHGPSVPQLFQQIGRSSAHPKIESISNHGFFQEIKNIVLNYSNLSNADSLNVMGSLYKIAAILVEENTASAWTIVPHDDSSILYTGDWTAWPSPFSSKHEHFYSSSNSAYAEYSFYGTGIKWFGVMNFNGGIADVIIDGILQTKVDTYSPTRLSSQLLYVNTKLPSGQHVIKISCSGEKNSKSTNTEIAIESFQYLTKSGEQFIPIPQCDSSSVVQRALTIMKSSYMHNLSIDRIASEIGVHRSYLTARFKAELGVSPAKYIVLTRINQAKVLLGNTDMPVGQVAISVGYPDSFYFSRIFKKVEGISPSQYRGINASVASDTTVV